MGFNKNGLCLEYFASSCISSTTNFTSENSFLISILMRTVVEAPQHLDSRHTLACRRPSGELVKTQIPVVPDSR